MKKLFIVACLLGLCSGSVLAYQSSPVRICLTSPDQETDYKISALRVDGDYLNKTYKTDYFFSGSEYYLMDNPQKPGKHLVFNAKILLLYPFYMDELTKEKWKLDEGWEYCGKAPQF